MRNLYAIGMKGWVEIRRHYKPPRLNETKTKMKVKERKISLGRYAVTEDRNGQLRVQYIQGEDTFVDKDMIFTNKTFIGGRVVDVVPAKKFTNITGLSVSAGAMGMLLPQHIEALHKKGYLGNGKPRKNEVTKATVDGRAVETTTG